MLRFGPLATRRGRSEKGPPCVPEMGQQSQGEATAGKDRERQLRLINRWEGAKNQIIIYYNIDACEVDLVAPSELVVVSIRIGRRFFCV